MNEKLIFTKTVEQCPLCGERNITPLPLITYVQAEMTEFKEHVTVDEKLNNQLKTINGYIPEERMLKQVVLDDETSQEIRNYIKDGRFQTITTGYQDINHCACPKCHFNLTALVDKNVKEIRIIPLIGNTGASKTTTLTSIVKLILERPYTGKDKIRILSPVQSYEYMFYKKCADDYPKVPEPTKAINGLCTQPVFCILVNSVLLVFVDNPGENFRDNLFVPLDNSTPLYLVDPDKNNNSFFSTVVNNIHTGGKEFSHEVVAFMKSDKIDQKTKDEIMMSDSEQIKPEFSELYCARKYSHRKLTNEVMTIYQNIITNCSENTDLVCAAALGTETERVTRDEEEVYEMIGEWEPAYLYDLLLTLAV